MKSFPRAIAHLDADCFFASVEIAKNPVLQGKPIGVCTRTDHRGIINAANYEARKFNIRAGTPVFQAKQLCSNIILIPGHFDDYEYFSREMFRIASSFSPDVEVTSIDEAYIDLTGLRVLYRTSYEGIAQKIQETIFEKLKLPVSLGIASTKLIAKIASDKAKPKGILAISEHKRKSFLANIHIGDIPGIGINTEALLIKMGFENALQFSRQTKDYIEKILGKRGLTLWFELNGIALSKVCRENTTLPKSLSRTSTFPDFSSNEKYIYSYSLKLLRCNLFRLRKYGMKAKILHYFLIQKDFQIMENQKILPAHNSENRLFFELLRHLFSQTYQKGVFYRKSGVILAHLIPEENTQPCLFQTSDKEENLGKTLDKLGSTMVFPSTLLYLKRK